MKWIVPNIRFPLLILAFIGIAVIGCGTAKDRLHISDDEREAFHLAQHDTVVIADDDTEYEIIIIEPGFDFWLQSVAKPEGYYSQSYLEDRNRIYVTNWNMRVMQPTRYPGDLYTLQIDYDPNIDYGYEVNYKLFNYFIYFQRKYGQRLGPWLPRV